MDAIGKKYNYKGSIRLPFVLLIVSITSILNWTSLRNSILNNTTILWSIYALTLFLIYKNRARDYKVLPIKLFIIYVIISAIYGIIISRGYWDYKLLVQNLLTFLLPISIYTFVYPKLVHNILSYIFKYIFIIFIASIPFMYSDAYAYMLQPFIFPALFFPLLNKKWRCLTIIAFIITIVMGYASRSCITRFAIAFILGYLCRFATFRKYQFKTTIALWIAPILFFCLATFGSFNIFNIDEEFQLTERWNLKTEKTATNDVAFDDTRTYLYKEVLGSSITKDYWLFGHSLARGYYSLWFSKQKDAAPIKELENERPGCEVSVLNIYTYMGICGVLIYMLIFIHSSYLAVCKSNNRFIPLIGLFVSFRWFFGWIEDFSSFNLTYILLWLIISICYSPYFRQMTDKDFIMWFKKIFK